LCIAAAAVLGWLSLMAPRQAVAVPAPLRRSAGFTALETSAGASSAELVAAPFAEDVPALSDLLDPSLQSVLQTTVPLWVFARRAKTRSPSVPAAVEAQLAASFRAQGGEDSFAYEHFFWGVVGGVILETGALDGLHFSTSYGLEAVAGWYSVHVEPGPANYRELVHNRPGALNIHMAICDRPRLVHFWEDRAVGGIVEFMSPEFIARWHERVNLSSAPPVTCLPLAPVLSMYAITHVDLWVLDVEGGELAVLQAVDWTRVSFDVLVVEAGQQNPSRNLAVRELLTARGFLWLGRDGGGAGGNWWFCRKGFTRSMKPGIDASGTPALSLEFD